MSFLEDPEGSENHIDFKSIQYRHLDNWAGDILEELIKRGSSLSLAECKEVFKSVRRLLHDTDQAEFDVIHHVVTLLNFLEHPSNPKGAWNSLSAFVERFGSAQAQEEFRLNRPLTREEARRIYERPVETLPERSQIAHLRETVGRFISRLWSS